MFVIFMGNKTQTSPRRTSPGYANYFHVERDQILNKIRELEENLRRIERTISRAPVGASFLTLAGLRHAVKEITDDLSSLMRRAERLDARYGIQ